MQVLRATVACGLLITAPLGAGVEVTPEAVHTGSFGLRAEVQPPCESEETVLVLGPVVTAQQVEACKEVVVAAEVQDGGDLLTLAGQRVAFADGFSVAPGGRLVAATTGEWNPSYVVDNTPQDEPELHVRWWARFDEAALAPGEDMTLLRVRAGGMERGWVHYEAGAESGEVWVEVLADDSQIRPGERLAIGPGWQRLELAWSAGSVLEPTGSVELRVDEGTPQGVTGVGLASAVEALELGVVAAEEGGGWVDLDDYVTARSGPIGDQKRALEPKN